MDTKKKIYIASGWFNNEQRRDLTNIKAILRNNNILFYSPKDEMEVTNMSSKKSQKDAFDENIKQIVNASAVIANTRDKDLGTIFECGVAFSNNIPIIYYCDGLTGNFNLMLGQSGICVATNPKELNKHLEEFKKNKNYKKEYTGDIE